MMAKAVETLRHKVADWIAPRASADSAPGIERFVRVRFFLPGIGPQVEVYDRQNAAEMQAWQENQRLYPIMQIIGYSVDRPNLDDEQIVTRKEIDA